MDKVGMTFNRRKITEDCRLLIGIATGIHTCADRVKMHEDGEEIDDKL